jgi:NAD(P)-dependent dehydrogenase (short-subunit alcohol dehydrogenase family)
MNTKTLQYKVAIITGSSRGIGKAIAIELAKQGAYIVLNGRNRLRLSETEKEISKIQSEVISVCCDLTTVEGGQFLIDQTINKFGRIDILVNNVGVSMRGKFADLNPEVYKTILDSNVLSAVNPSIPALQYLRATQGSLIFISSLAGIRGLPGMSAYCSAKMALRGIAESIRIEESKSQIHVGLIYVGYTEIDEGKETIYPDGTKKLLGSRNGRGAQTKVYVAKAVVKNIRKRKFLTVFTPIGKINLLLQRLFPMLGERILIRNIKKFESFLN